MVIMHAPFFYIEEEYHKEGNQYKTSDGKIVESIEGYENLDEVMKRSINRQGEIVYYPVKLVEADYPKIYLTGKKLDPPNNLIVHYTDGTTQELETTGYQMTENKREEKVELYENQQIPVVYSENMMDSRFIGMGAKLYGQPVSVVDLRSNTGGKLDYVDKWFEGYSKQKVTPNYFSIYTAMFQDQDIQEDEIQEIKGKMVYQAGEDTFAENEDLLILLTSCQTMSAAESFADRAHNVENTLLIGESTTGALRGDIWLNPINLPYSKVQTYFGQRFCEFPEGYFEEGYGFEPDLWCPAVYAEEAAVNFVHRMMK